MSYLLDTNVLIWASANYSRLGRNTARLIATAPLLYFSPISIAELQMKHMRGKLRMDPDFVNVVTASGFTELPFSQAHANSMARFGSLVDHDPMDRMIVAQAAAEGLNLITADRKLLDLGFTWLIDANQ